MAGSSTPVKVRAFLGWLWATAMVVALAPPALAIDPAWYTNNYGDNRTYTIARFSGRVEDPNPAIVVSPDPATFASKHVAWPSAVTAGNRVYLYAAGHDGTSWQGIGLWTSSDGRNFTFEGRVLAPRQDELEIRMAHVLRDGELFRMWYSAVVVAGALPTEIRYAESADGRRWERGESVLTSGAAYDAAGLVPDWVCRDDTQWHLFYTAYDSHERSVAALAVGAAPDRVFERQGVVLRNDGVGAALVSRAGRGATEVELANSEGFRPGGAYVFSRSEDGWVQVVTLTEVEGVRARFRPALEKGMAVGSRLDSIARRKLSPSVAWRGAAGWTGIFTGYGAVPQRLLEYTFWVRADSASAFSFLTERASPAFPAERSELRHSTENPEPLREDASCSPSCPGSSPSASFDDSSPERRDPDRAAPPYRAPGREPDPGSAPRAR